MIEELNLLLLCVYYVILLKHGQTELNCVTCLPQRAWARGVRAGAWRARSTMAACPASRGSSSSWRGTAWNRLACVWPPVPAVTMEHAPQTETTALVSQSWNEKNLECWKPVFRLQFTEFAVSHFSLFTWTTHLFCYNGFLNCNQIHCIPGKTIFTMSIAMP